ncbi:hypothetical protein C8R42DRAFT_648356 [Lentinula raphanica]|nr:hypothetical protein C8R42DRAFT_648356 [Lentinula raphanica]
MPRLCSTLAVAVIALAAVSTVDASRYWDSYTLKTKWDVLIDRLCSPAMSNEHVYSRHFARHYPVPRHTNKHDVAVTGIETAGKVAIAGEEAQASNPERRSDIVNNVRTIGDHSEFHEGFVIPPPPGANEAIKKAVSVDGRSLVDVTEAFSGRSLESDPELGKNFLTKAASKLLHHGAKHAGDVADGASAVDTASEPVQTRSLSDSDPELGKSSLSFTYESKGLTNVTVSRNFLTKAASKLLHHGAKHAGDVADGASAVDTASEPVQTRSLSDSDPELGKSSHFSVYGAKELTHITVSRNFLTKAASKLLHHGAKHTDDVADGASAVDTAADPVESRSLSDPDYVSLNRRTRKKKTGAKAKAAPAPKADEEHKEKPKEAPKEKAKEEPPKPKTEPEHKEEHPPASPPKEETKPAPNEGTTSTGTNKHDVAVAGLTAAGNAAVAFAGMHGSDSTPMMDTSSPDTSAPA